MINSNNLINDGLNSSNPSACVNNGGTKWTYNQGVILGGLAELYQADQDSTLLLKAESIANAVLSSNLVNANGILAEPTISGGDNPQFKGIFIRNLRALYLVAPNSTYQQFIDTNANSILAYDQCDGYEFGALWQGEFDSADATRQTSALDALISAVALQGVPS
jgi:predicted alpha-1,6-mannanase (GH76 family)